MVVGGEEEAGCHVTALELQPDISSAAASLTARCGDGIADRAAIDITLLLTTVAIRHKNDHNESR